MLDGPRDLTSPLLANYPEIPDSWFPLQLTLIKDVQNVLIDRANIFIKQFGHLPLRQPDGLATSVQTHVDRLLGIFVDQNLWLFAHVGLIQMRWRLRTISRTLWGIRRQRPGSPRSSRLLWSQRQAGRNRWRDSAHDDHHRQNARQQQQVDPGMNAIGNAPDPSRCQADAEPRPHRQRQQGAQIHIPGIPGA